MSATHVALLRAVNLGAHNKVSMRELGTLLASLGLQDVQTLLLSGNLVFRCDLPTTAEVETMLQDAASARLGLQTDVFVRTVREWRTIIAGNPFPDVAEHDPSHLVVMCLRAAPGRAAHSALQGAITGRELVRVRGREAYVVYPDGIGRSRLTSRVLERTLGTSGTGRNWNTVVKLGAMLGLS